MYFSKLNALLWIAELQSFLRLLKNILQAPQEEEPLFSLPADLTIFPSHHIFYPPVLRSTTLMDIKWKKEIANNLTVKQSEFKEAFEMSNNFRTAVCVIHILDISQISALYQFMNRHFYDNVQIFSPLVVILYFHQIYFVSLQIFAIHALFQSKTHCLLLHSLVQNIVWESKFYWKELLKHLWENPQNMQAFNHITPSWRHFNFSPKRKEEPRQGMNIILTYSHTYDNDIHHPVKYVFPMQNFGVFWLLYSVLMAI